MSSQDLNLSSVELTSTLRTAPLNGPTSSSDYNSSQRENLVDLATLADFINNILLPLLNALPAGALLPIATPVGIEGRTIWTDTSDKSSLFFDTLSSVPLTLADTIRVLNGIVSIMQQQLIDQGIEVASLQARLASTNQNDISLALQNITSSLNQLTVIQELHDTTITEITNAQITVEVNGVAATNQAVLNFVGSGISISDAGNGEILFSAYVAPAFTSISNNTPVIEVGATVTSVTVSWTLNKVVTSLQITGADSHLTPNAVPITLPVNTTSQVFTGSYTPSSPVVLSWTLTADDGTNTAGATTNVSFEQKRYWGVSALTSLTNGQILALGHSEFGTNLTKTITYDCTGGAYPYYVYPASFGNPSNVTVGNLTFTDYTITTQSFTNASGYVSTYNVIRFNLLQTGSNIVVSWS
jgi:hypothetical protein